MKIFESCQKQNYYIKINHIFFYYVTQFFMQIPLTLLYTKKINHCNPLFTKDNVFLLPVL